MAEQPDRDSPEAQKAFMERLGNLVMPPTDSEAAQATDESPEAEEPAPDEQTEEAPAEEAAEDKGLVELELDGGEVVRVPEKYKDGYLRQADYTRKTQDLAALQKTAQAALDQQQLINKFNEQTKDDQQKLAQIRGELQRWRSVDLTSLDTDAYIKNRAYIDNLKEQAGDVEKELGQKAQSVQKEYAQKRREASQHAYEYIAREVRDWQPDSQTERDVASYARGKGIAPEVMAELAVNYPAVAVALYKAKQYDGLQSGKSAIVKKAMTAPPVVRPGATTNTQTVQAQKFKAIRSDLKKSGSEKDLARLLLFKGT